MPADQLAESRAGRKTDQRVNILLVDDHPENLMALESVLADLDQNLVTARSGREALRYVLEEDFACILLDVQMPDINGYETAALIREREKSSHTPILFITAYNKSETHVTQGYSVGAVDYVFKPYEPDVLRAKVSAFVDLSRKTQELKEEVERRKKAEAEVRTLNQELERRVRQRTAELERANRDLQREVVERKRAEHALRANQKHIEDLNERLRRAMTETHHRVKNNLQIIAAMVDMRLMDNPKSIDPEEIQRLGQHVRALAAVHDILTHEAKEDGQAHFISSEEVLVKLVEMLQETVPNRRLNCNIEEMRLSARQGTSLALILNELISNALKYSDGDVDVSMSVVNGQGVLAVADSGPGFPEGFDPSKAANTGLELIHSLSQWDLGGGAEYSNRPEGGAKVVVTMPIPEE